MHTLFFWGGGGGGWEVVCVCVTMCVFFGGGTVMRSGIEIDSFRLVIVNSDRERC